jgi:RNA polymerase sigma-70 factor (ECF subfamily)
MDEPQHPAPGSEPTTVLLARAREGDAAARERLLARFLPRLRRWAHGRLPGYARGAVDTDDLVQLTLLRALNHLGEFKPEHEGAFLAYLRRILLNAIRDEIRRAARHPPGPPLDDSYPDELPSLVEEMVGKETMERYEGALARLSEREREAVILRLEFGYAHAEIAEAVGSPSANAARMMLSRALVRVAEELRRGA